MNRKELEDAGLLYRKSEPKSDLMTFPDSVEEFMERYKIVDTDGIYMSKGAELVPIFRMRQWFEHLPTARRTGRWIWDDEGYHCTECFYHAYGNTSEVMLGDFKFCPNCGARMEEQE